VTVRVMVFASVDADRADGFERAFTEVRATMAGTPGLLTDELLREPGEIEVGEGGAVVRYVMLSEWASEQEFRAWEEGGDHRDTSAPMRPYWSGAFDRRVYAVAVPVERDAPPHHGRLPNGPPPC
jgi:heme-degrading monooxygenase HmoA